MNGRTKDLVYRYSVALAILYGLLAVRYFMTQGAVEEGPYLQSLILGWAFAVTAVVASVLPARPRPPHLRG